MKYQRSKKWVTMCLATYLGVVAIVAALYIMLEFKRHNAVQEKQAVETQLNTLKSQLKTLQEKAAEINESTKGWKELPDKYTKMEGLQIDASQALIKTYGERYHIHNMEVHLSTPAPLPSPYKTDTVLVMSARLNLKFSSFSDEDALAFAQLLTNDLPGYIRLTSLKLSRQLPLSKEVLESIANGQQPEVVSGELAFDWKALKIPGNTNK